MKKLALFAILMYVTHAFPQQSTAKRPKITGIDHVDFYTTSADANRHLYVDVLGLTSDQPVEPGQTQRFIVTSPRMQWVGYRPAPDANATNRMDHVAFRTEDCEGMRAYLSANGVKVPSTVGTLKDGSRSLVVQDPEGNKIEFVQPAGRVTGELKTQSPVSRRMIHAGFIVRDRAAEDHFYKDILGFRPYWYGGMHPERTDWVSLQVPDGTDWLEYMLNQPANPDLRLSGIMNHISLGVKDMKVAQAALEANGWTPHGDEISKIGKDGKWQLNLFDPDRTRVELMEFAPAEKPCCSEFTGPHPSEDR
jgi:catechol 2,3-dioxygenase-like lactoylglutathione lyase family enzyme